MCSYRKPHNVALSYLYHPSGRPQHITIQQLAALQQAAVPQQVSFAGHQKQQPIQPELIYDTNLDITKAGHGNVYKVTPSQPRPHPQHQIQYASSAIVDSTAGKFILLPSTSRII